MKKTTRLSKLMDSYYQRQLVTPNSVSFLFHGHCLEAYQTPNEVAMEDNVEIHAIHAEHVDPDEIDIGDGDVIDALFDSDEASGSDAPTTIQPPSAGAAA